MAEPVEAHGIFPVAEPVEAHGIFPVAEPAEAPAINHTLRLAQGPERELSLRTDTMVEVFGDDDLGGMNAINRCLMT